MCAAYEQVANRLNDLGFIRLRNGTPTPKDEDRELIMQVMSGCLGGASIADDDESGLLLRMLGMK